MIKKEVVNLFLVILFFNLVCAGFQVGNLSHSVSTTYGPFENLKGWVNMSFSNEAVDSVFEDSLGNSIALRELVENSSGFVYTCSTKDCSSDYSVLNPETSKTFNLEDREEAIVGLKFSGEISSIDSIDFLIDSDATSSCYNQIGVDILGDGSVDIVNDRFLSDACAFLKSYGCYDQEEGMSNPTITITSVPYCERVSVFESPALRLGAWVVESSSGNSELTMSLYTLEGELRDSCKLPKNNLSGGEVFCDINYSITSPEEYYVCLYSDGGTGGYRTRGYSTSAPCGFSGFPLKQELNAYHVFAQTKSFASVGTMNITNELLGGNSINSIVNNYLYEHYGDLNCSDDCVVPIKIISGQNQELTLKGLKVSYSKPGLSGIIDDKFYDINETSATLTSEFQKLYLDSSGFSLPSKYGSINFVLDFNDEEIFSEDISIEDVPLIGSISPITTASAFPTLFTVSVLNNNSKNFEWDFGDNKTISTTTNEVTHTYSSSGDYNVVVSITDSLQRTSIKSFAIKVVSPKELINTTIEEDLANIKNTKAQISQFDAFYQKSLNLIFDFELFDKKLKEIQKDYEIASSEEDYNSIMTELLELNIPKLVLTTKSADEILSFPKEDYIDLYVLETVGGGSYDIDKADDYINAVLLWNQQNLETKISFKEISARYKDSDEPVLRFFKIRVVGKNEFAAQPYFILQKPEGLNFDKDYSESEESGFVYFELDGDKTISFSTTENIDFTNLPFFISPKINSLPVKKPIDVGEEETFSKWVLFISIMFLLLIAGVIVYIVLQRWYKNKYETYLFKNRNNLYNLVVYIQNSRKKGVKDGEIASRLRKSGWTSEQVNYAMKKHAGKRTGMFELPIGGVLDKLKKKGIVKEDKKQANPFNQRKF